MLFRQRNLLTSVLAVSLLCCSGSWAANYKVLYAFSGGNDGGGLYSGVILGPQRGLYGGTVGGGQNFAGTIYKLSREPNGSWTKSTIYDFANWQRDGASPNNGIVFDPAGNLYGTTSNGGPQDFGTTFQLTPVQDGEWNLNLLYDEGAFTGLVLDPAGNLFGLGAGAFELSPGPDGWTYLQIYGFIGDHIGGFYAPMILDSAGNLYGSATYGGNGLPNCPGSAGCGVVFKLHPNSDGSWTEHTLHKFAAWKYDGAYPRGGVVRDAKGNVYGTTGQGGYRTKQGTTCELGCGTIYKLARQPNGHWKETILYNFLHFKDGLFPVAGPTLGTDGNLYGTASYGGDSKCGCGVVYKMTHNPDESWTYSVLHRIHQGEGNGPVAPLVMDKKGNLYGTTVTGGPGGKGVVFQVMP